MKNDDLSRVDGQCACPVDSPTASTNEPKSTPTCEKCQDTGAYVVKTEDEGKGFGGYSTLRCACRAMLGPREGRASWWAAESVLHVDVTIPIFKEVVSIDVSSEVPMSEDNYRLHRRGNRYYPTLIHVEQPSDLTMHADTARNLARALMQAADAVDKIDDADTALCGHWYPCDCSPIKAEPAPAADAVDPHADSTGPRSTREKDSSSGVSQARMVCVACAQGDHQYCLGEKCECIHTTAGVSQAPEPDEDGLVPDFTVWIVRRGSRFPMVIDSIFMDETRAQMRAKLLGHGEGWTAQPYSHLKAAPQVSEAPGVSQAPPQAWAPIASAPKDGTALLAWCPRDMLGCGDWQIVIFFADRWEDGEGDPCDPTHWMPLPPAPTPPPEQT